MRKSIIAVAVIALGIFIATNVDAANRKYTKDLMDNGRSYTDIYCPSGTTLVGFAYFDLRNDSADAASVICERKNGEEIIPKDHDWPQKGLREIQRHKCDKRTERLWSVRYKDRDVFGKHRDAMDGFVVGCKNKRTGKIRYTWSNDLIGGREWTTVSSGGKKIIGFSYKDGGCGGIKSDCADGVTLVFK